MQSTLANLAGAINASSANGQAAGTTYSTGTVANTAVTAAGSTATAITLQAIKGGAGGDSLCHFQPMGGWHFRRRGSCGRSERRGRDLDIHRARRDASQCGRYRGRGWNNLHFCGTASTPQSPADTVLIVAGDHHLNSGQPGGCDQREPAQPGTAYGTSTTANAAVSATGPSATTFDLQALAGGTAAIRSLPRPTGPGAICGHRPVWRSNRRGGELQL